MPPPDLTVARWPCPREARVGLVLQFNFGCFCILKRNRLVGRVMHIRQHSREREHGYVAQPRSADRAVCGIVGCDASPRGRRSSEVRQRRGLERRECDTRRRRAQRRFDDRIYHPVRPLKDNLRSLVEPGGSGLALVNQLVIQPQVEILTHHVHGTLCVPGGDLPVLVQALLYCVERDIDPETGERGSTRGASVGHGAFPWTLMRTNILRGVRAVEHQTVLLRRTLMTPWGDVRFQSPFVILPSSDNLVIRCQATLREVLGLDVM